MKSIIVSLLLLLFNAYTFAQTKKEVKEIQTYFSSMIGIKGGTYTTGIKDLVFTLPKDSFLVLPDLMAQVTVEDFVISNHEVTVSEYFAFVDWVQDSIKVQNHSVSAPVPYYSYPDQRGKIITIDIYPDTILGSRYNRPFSHYLAYPLLNFREPVLKDYPVQGVSWKQANAYIHWLNKQMKRFLNEHHSTSEKWGNFRLPIEKEWEYAAQPYDQSNVHINDKFFPWDENNLKDKENKSFCNMGETRDENGFKIITSYADGYFYTAPVKSYNQNVFGLYDMAGNVSEWVADTSVINNITENMYYDYGFIKDHNRNKNWMDHLKQEMDKDDLDFNKINQLLDLYSESFCTKYLIKKHREMQLIKKTINPRVAKGGSWFDEAAYLMCASRQLYPETATSMRIGFRVAMTLTEEMKKYIVLNSVSAPVFKTK